MHWLDPDYLPAVKGIIRQFLVNPHGEADGLILADGAEVHFPPHMSAAVESAVKPGDEVTVRGAKPRGADMIAAVAIDTASGHRIEDFGPPDGEDRHGKPQAPKQAGVEHEGIVVRALHGPKGEVRGLLFEDGISVRFSKKGAGDLIGYIVPGSRLAVRGEAIAAPAGTVIEAREIGSSLNDLKPIKSKKSEHAKKDSAVSAGVEDVPVL